MKLVMQPERQWLIDRFSYNLLRGNLDSHCNILVIGGGLNEPELKVLKCSSATVYFAGIDRDSIGSNFYYLDLNIKSEIEHKFDLIICNQVLEHIYNPQVAFNNFSELTREGGFVWVTVPSANFRHGSPEYYASGYSREFISRNMKLNGFEQLDIGELCNERIHLYRQILRIWPSRMQLRYPMYSYFGVQGSIGRKIMFNLSTLIARTLLLLSSSEMSIDGNHSIETFGFFQKTRDRIV